MTPRGIVVFFVRENAQKVNFPVVAREKFYAFLPLWLVGAVNLANVRLLFQVTNGKRAGEISSFNLFRSPPEYRLFSIVPLRSGRNRPERCLPAIPKLSASGCQKFRLVTESAGIPLPWRPAELSPDADESSGGIGRFFSGIGSNLSLFQPFDQTFLVSRT